MTSIVLQLGRSNLENPFDGQLPYEDWPLMCWTYATNCLLKYANILSWLHSPGECEGRSIPRACFFPLPASLSMYSDSSHVHIALKYSFQKTPNVAHSHVVQVMKFSDTW